MLRLILRAILSLGCMSFFGQAVVLMFAAPKVDSLLVTYLIASIMCGLAAMVVDGGTRRVTL